MKRVKTTVTTIALVFAMASCGPKGATDRNHTDHDSTSAPDVEAAVATDSSTEQDIAVIEQFYAKSVFGGNQEFAIANATPKFIDELREAYDFDGEGLALWIMRSDSQDGDDDTQEVKSVTADGDGWYTVVINDMGTEMTVHIFMVDHKIADFTN